MADDQNPRLVIRAKDGTEIDLAEFRATIISAQGMPGTYSVDPDDAERILDALVAALSVPEETPLQVRSEWDAGYEDGWYKRGKATRQAAGVVEGEG